MYRLVEMYTKLILIGLSKGYIKNRKKYQNGMQDCLLDNLLIVKDVYMSVV